MAGPSTPKFKSAEFKAALGALKAVYDSHALGITLVDALDRRVIEQLYARFGNPGRGIRTRSVAKTALAEKITQAFFSADDVAYQALRELDRAAKKERNIVASIPTEQAQVRVRSYRAISLKRERARFVWALARDPRPALQALATELVNAHFAEQAQLETSQRVLAGEEDPSALEQVELAKRLKDQSERLREAASQASSLRAQIEALEAERTQLLVKLGRSERSLRLEAKARQAAEQQLKARPQAPEPPAPEDRSLEAKQAAEIATLQSKLRRLDKLAGASKSLTAAQEALDLCERSRETERRAWERAREGLQREQAAHQDMQAKLQAELDGCRESLHQARQRLAQLEPLQAQQRSPDPAPEGLVVLLDQANLAATASAIYGRKVDFQAVLSQVLDGRPLARAVAFVVDNGGANFDGFCDALRHGGWELRVKKPKRFADGKQKADWDMSIAMEAVQLIGVAQTICLVSGDGDFAPLARHLRRAGLRVEAAGYDRTLASELMNAVDRTTLLNGCLE